MADELARIAQAPDQKSRVEEYRSWLHKTVQTGSGPSCDIFIDHILQSSVPLTVSRPLLSAFVQEIAALPTDLRKDVASHALEGAQPRVVSYEEQVTQLRELLADLYAQEEDFTKAAQLLSGIDLDSGHRLLGPEYKLKQNIRIAMLYLEDDDAVNAEAYIKKASSLIASSKNPELELQYKSSYARVLDSKRRFLEAATRYYELSQTGAREVGGQMISEEDLTQALTAAVTCCILASAGPQRSRVLAKLYKDERCARLPLFPFLQKVFLDRILTRGEVEAFSGMLKPHQRATTSDGSTVLDKAVVEHNLAACAALYCNISTQQLGTVLGTSPEAAEAIAARMVKEGRLKAVIDQVEGSITFDADAEAQLAWDDQIASICNQLNSVLDRATGGIQAH